MVVGYPRPILASFATAACTQHQGYYILIKIVAVDFAGLQNVATRSLYLRRCCLLCFGKKEGREEKILIAEVFCA